MSDRIFIIAAKRTPIGSFGGNLKNFNASSLAAQLAQKILAEAGVDPAHVDRFFLGCCSQLASKEVLAPIVARQAGLEAGFPDSLHSCTIDRACTSGMYAIKMGMDAIRLGEAKLALVGGTEVLSNTPYLHRATRFGARIGGYAVEDPVAPLGYKDYNPVAIDAADVALEYGISREMQDDWAFASQTKYQAAKSAGKWSGEIIPIEVPQKKGDPVLFSDDEYPKANLVREKMTQLPTVFGSRTVTAGNAPGLNDGAAMMLIAGESALKEHGLTAIGEIVDYVTISSRPAYINTVPGIAINALLEKCGLAVDDLECIEINEAFAAVPLTSSLVLAYDDRERAEAIRRRINVNGGSIAMGHPVGATGCRISITALHELRRRGGGYAAAAICGGLAQGDALLIKA